MVSSSHTRAIYNTPLHTKLRGYYERGGGWTIKARGHRGLVQNNVFPIRHDYCAHKLKATKDQAIPHSNTVGSDTQAPSPGLAEKAATADFWERK